MPNETEDKKNGAGNDNDKGGSENKGSADDVVMKKSDFEKIQSDSENYKTMGNKYKTDAEKWQAHEKTEKDKQNQDQGNQQDKDKQTDVVQTIEQTTRKILKENNEKSAQSNFKKTHPEYQDATQWTSLLAELTFKGGEQSVDEIHDRLEAALLEHKRKTGKLDEYLKSETERARREGRLEGFMGQGRSGGDGGDKNESEKAGTITPKGQEMASSMHVDTEKLKKVDASRDNVIDVTQKKNK